MTGDQRAERLHIDGQIDWVLNHEGTSPWLKDALRDALEVDPVTADNDAELLRQLLRRRAQMWAQDQFAKVTLAHVSR